MVRALVILAATSVMAAAPAGEDVPRIGGFRPSSHGFHFVNTFSGSPFGSGLGLLPSHYGLCGGMSLAAADHYVAACEVPAIATPPQAGSRWHRYLWKRQAQSMGLLGWRAARFVQWMALPDDTADGTQARTARHFGITRERLERGDPAPLGLVFTRLRDGGLPWHNHQVLAYGLTEREGGVIDIAIYDPNFPHRDDVVIRMTPVGVDAGVAGYACERVVPGRRASKVRGFFPMGYVRREPPRFE